MPEAQFLYPNGSRYQILQYPYIEGGHIIENVRQVSSAVRALNKFHESDLVHGDIRETNLIVRDNDVYIIDLDFVRREGSFYPSTFNHTDICVYCREVLTQPF